MDNSFNTHFDKEVYYYVGNLRVRLFPDPQVFAVRLDQDTHIKPEMLSPRFRQILEEAEGDAASDRLNVYRAKSD